MSNYNSLKTTINTNIKQNGVQAITGTILNAVLNEMVTTLGAGYQFAGVATIATEPGTPDAKVFYIANGKGTYTYFGGLQVTEDDVVVLYWDFSWHKVSTGIASQEKLTELEYGVYNIKDITSKFTSTRGRYVKYATGEVVSAAAYWYTYSLDNVDLLNIDKITINAGANSNTQAIIAFLSDNEAITVGTTLQSYMSSQSIQSVANQTSYTATIPQNCKKIVITNNTNIASVVSVYSLTSIKSEIAKTTETADYAKQKADIATGNINTINNNLFVWKDSKSLFTYTNKRWLRYSDGTLKSSSNTNLGVYVLKNVDILGVTAIKVNTGYSDVASAAIAFFSENEELEVDVAPTSYLSSLSVQSKKNLPDEIYEANVPSNCKMIAITNKADIVANPSIMMRFGKVSLLEEDLRKTKAVLADTNKKVLPSFYNDFLFGNKPVYGHYFIDTFNNVSEQETELLEQIIPCQSLADVNATARLGCKYIEVNVKTTSDGVLIPIHGYQGAFGSEVVDTNGAYTYKDTLVSSVTYDWIKQNIRYRSKYGVYQTTIPTLGEFFAYVKSNGMSVMLQYTEDSYELAKKYFDDDFIAYNGNRDSGFTGIIMNYSGASTKEAILSLCDKYGAPYFHSLNTSAFPIFKNAGTLKDLIQSVHEENCKVGIAASYHSVADIVAFFKAGGDYIASASFVNDFENGNVLNKVGNVDFSDFTHTGTVQNGKLYLTSSQYIDVPSTEQVYLGKQSLRIRFKGSLKLYRFGHKSFDNRVFTHEESEELWISSYLLEQQPQLHLTAQTDTEIECITYKVSKV